MEVIELMSIILTAIGMTVTATWVIAIRLHQLETQKLRDEIKLKQLEIDTLKHQVEQDLSEIQKLRDKIKLKQLEIDTPKSSADIVPDPPEESKDRQEEFDKCLTNLPNTNIQKQTKDILNIMKELSTEFNKLIGKAFPSCNSYLRYGSPRIATLKVRDRSRRLHYTVLRLHLDNNEPYLNFFCWDKNYPDHDERYKVEYLKEKLTVLNIFSEDFSSSYNGYLRNLKDNEDSLAKLRNVIMEMIFARAQIDQEQL